MLHHQKSELGKKQYKDVTPESAAVTQEFLYIFRESVMLL